MKDQVKYMKSHVYFIKFGPNIRITWSTGRRELCKEGEYLLAKFPGDQRTHEAITHVLQHARVVENIVSDLSREADVRLYLRSMGWIMKTVVPRVK